MRVDTQIRLSIIKGANLQFNSYYMDLIPFGADPFGQGFQFPKIDIKETTKDIVVVADIPGVNPKKINVEVSESAVKISGTSEYEKETKDKNFYRKERSTQSFSRVVPLPCLVKSHGVKAVSQNGMLTIVLPKKNPDTPKMKKIPVEEA